MECYAVVIVACVYVVYSSCTGIGDVNTIVVSMCLGYPAAGVPLPLRLSLLSLLLPLLLPPSIIIHHDRAVPFIPMPMAKPVCIMYLSNKWVQYETFLGRGWVWISQPSDACCESEGGGKGRERTSVTASPSAVYKSGLFWDLEFSVPN